MPFNHVPKLEELERLKEAGTGFGQTEDLEKQCARVAYLTGVALRDLSAMTPMRRDLGAIVEVAEAAFLGARALYSEVRNGHYEDDNAI
jgi:hypothetical protein